VFKEYTRSGMIRRVLLSALFGLLFWVSSQLFATEQDDSAQCLVISDRHRLSLSGGMSVEHLDLAAIAKPAS
jgi:hypothetical protein